MQYRWWPTSWGISRPLASAHYDFLCGRDQGATGGSREPYITAEQAEILRPLLPADQMAFLLLSACNVITHDYLGQRELTPGTQLSQSSESIGSVSGSKKAMFVLFGWIPINNGSGAQLAETLAVEQYGEDFDGITEIRIEEQADPVDVIVNFLVGMFFSMKTVEVDGSVHRVSKSEG